MAILTAVIPLVVMAVIVVRRDRSAGPAGPRLPTAADINARPAVAHSQVVIALGDKIIARAITSHGDGTGLLGVVHLAPDGGLAVIGTTVLAQGSEVLDRAGTRRSGTWAFPIDGSRRQVYLGTSSDFRPSVDSRQVVLVNGTTALEVTLADGSSAGPPHQLSGRLVASVGRGLLMQEGDRIVCGTSPSDSELIGTGTALGGQGPYVLWQRADGRLVITDSYTLAYWPTAVTVPVGRPLGVAAASPDNSRVAVFDGDILRIGDGTVGSHVVTVPLHSVRDIAWLNDNTLLVTESDRGVVAIDGATGVVVREPDFEFDARGLAAITPLGT